MYSMNAVKKRYYIGFVLLVIMIISCKASKVLFPELNEKDTNWQMTESIHYYIYYRPFSPASENVKNICKDLDSCFEDVLTQLQVDFHAKIYYYLYNSQEDFKSHTGSRAMGFAESEFQCAAEIYAYKFIELNAHETAHVIADNTMGSPDLYFLIEGVAVSMERAYNKDSSGKLDLYSYTQYLIYRNEMIPLEILANNDLFNEIRLTYNALNEYFISSSFVRYLTDQYGLERFKLLYSKAREDNYRQVFYEVYNISIEDFEQEWHNFLRNYGTIEPSPPMSENP
jgi:hypothetical protein